ncbi:MAG: peptide MFS transporter [Tuberibacillus sp.]
MVSLNLNNSGQEAAKGGFFGHPKGLFTLFFTELWERFSYYGMRAILLYYMYDQVSHGGLGLKDSTAMAIMSIYGALVFMSSIIGGWIADRVLGNRKTVFWGGILIMCGHIALSFPGGVTALFVSMIFIILGSGLMKPNISTIVGNLYSPTDSRRDSGFSIFYMSINIGAFMSPYIAGTLGQKINYHLGFGSAAIGMALGLIIYLVTERKYMGDVGKEVKNPLEPAERTKVLGLFSVIAAVIIVLAVIAKLTGTLTIDNIVNFISILGILIPVCYFIFMYRSPKTTKDERSRVLAYIPLFVSGVMFWSIEEQGSSILASYADKRTQLDIGGFHIASSWFQSLNPVFIIIFAPVFAALWMKLGNRQPSTSRKFSFGLILAGLSYLIMIIPAYVNGTHSLVNPLWLVASFFLVTIGELCLSPVGISATTKLAPKAFAAQMMSLWLLTDAAAQSLNAQLAPLYNPHNEIAYFSIIGGVSVILGLLMFLIAPFIQRFMRGVN